jgi:signal transduction histidine kinase/sugar lactone lactonase YvrE
MRDRRGGVWVATFGGGLLRVDDPASATPRLGRVDFEQRLSGSPRSIYQDRDGNIWVGMRGGLLRLTETSFESAGPLEGITNEGVRTAAVGPDGDVWVATGHSLNRFSATDRLLPDRTGGARRQAGGLQRTTYAIPQTLALLRDRRGAMWVATADRFGRVDDDGRFVPVEVPGLLSARVMAMADDGERIWMCTAVKGVMTWNGTALAGFDDQADVSTRGCQSILTDRLGRVWIGFVAGGAALYDRGVFRTLPSGPEFTAGTVQAILESRNGAIWFATSDGVTRYQNGRFTALTRANAPLEAVVPVLVEDAEGYVWAGVNSGAAVLRVHPAEVDKVAGDAAYRIKYTLYDETDGMERGSQMWQSGVGGVRGGDGRLWVATGLGMTIIDPGQLPHARGPSPPHLQDVAADGERIGLAPDLSFARGTTLSVEYGALSLSSASKLRFRHMLNGVDRDWIYDGDTRAATYRNLAPGDYRFLVSTTHDGQWTDATTWAFTVAPPFYLTRWFIAAAAAVVAAIVAIAWWLRMRAIQHRFALVFAERARVSREIHDTLLQSLAALGTELEALAAQPQSEQGDVRPELRRIRRQVGHSLREARDSILELRRSSMRTRRLVDSLRDFADHVGQRRGVHTDLVVSGRRPDDASGEVDMQLFRIAQEAVNNAIRHGQATRIRIGIVYENNRVALTVQDNGCGFSPETEADPARLPGEHFGLLSMRERAERIHGQLRIESSPGRGTTIETMAPVKAA